MLNIHLEGGINFMLPLTLLFLANIGIITYVAISTFTKKPIKMIWLDAIKQIGVLAFVWGAFSTLIGFYAAFDDLSKMTETLPFNVIMGGLKVALITVLYGLIICTISLLSYVGLRVMYRKYEN